MVVSTSALASLSISRCSMRCALLVLSMRIYTPFPAAAISWHICSLSLVTMTLPSLSRRKSLARSPGIGAPSGEPTPITYTIIPFSTAALAASTAPPSWFSPSVMIMIAFPTPSFGVKLRVAISMAAFILVP